jgi:transposase
MAEGNRQRRVFPDAFKLEAVAAVQGGRSVSQVAAELGLPDRLVRGWLRWAAGRGTAGSGAPARARLTKPPRSRGYGVNSTACGWSATS